MYVSSLSVHRKSKVRTRRILGGGGNNSGSSTDLDFDDAFNAAIAKQKREEKKLRKQAQHATAEAEKKIKEAELKIVATQKANDVAAATEKAADKAAATAVTKEDAAERAAADAEAKENNADGATEREKASADAALKKALAREAGAVREAEVAGKAAVAAEKRADQAAALAEAKEEAADTVDGVIRDLIEKKQALHAIEARYASLDTHLNTLKGEYYKAVLKQYFTLGAERDKLVKEYTAQKKAAFPEIVYEITDQRYKDQSKLFLRRSHKANYSEKLKKAIVNVCSHGGYFVDANFMPAHTFQAPTKIYLYRLAKPSIVNYQTLSEGYIEYQTFQKMTANFTPQKLKNALILNKPMFSKKPGAEGKMYDTHSFNEIDLRVYDRGDLMVNKYFTFDITDDIGYAKVVCEHDFFSNQNLLLDINAGENAFWLSDVIGAAHKNGMQEIHLIDFSCSIFMHGAKEVSGKFYNWKEIEGGLEHIENWDKLKYGGK